MKALSVNQPWAWLIVNGLKDIENRDWYTHYRGTVLIHTGLKFDDDFDWSIWEEVAKTTIPTNPFQGGIIGQVDIVDCVEHSDSPWFFGGYGFVLENAKQFYNPRPCKGALGFFTPDYNSKYADRKKENSMKTATLFDLPRTKPRKLMHVIDAGTDKGHVHMKCNHCGYDDGWAYYDNTVTELKRGLPCPKCN